VYATFRSTVIAALASVVGFGVPPAAAEGEPQTVVIVHPDRAGYDPDRRQLRALFTMRVTVWPDGKPARVFVLPDRSELHDQFCRERLGTYPYVLRSVWDRKIYTGVGLAPVEVRSEVEMQQKVLSTPGAIGYVRVTDHSFLPDSLRELAARASETSGG
jgi:ABC-type phosphate transport system substrate-binding protein